MNRFVPGDLWQVTWSTNMMIFFLAPNLFACSKILERRCLTCLLFLSLIIRVTTLHAKLWSLVLETESSIILWTWLLLVYFYARFLSNLLRDFPHVPPPLQEAEELRISLHELGITFFAYFFFSGSLPVGRFLCRPSTPRLAQIHSFLKTAYLRTPSSSATSSAFLPLALKRRRAVPLRYSILSFVLLTYSALVSLATDANLYAMRES